MIDGCAVLNVRNVLLSAPNDPLILQSLRAEAQTAGTLPVPAAGGIGSIANENLITYEPHVPGSAPARGPGSGH